MVSIVYFSINNHPKIQQINFTQTKKHTTQKQKKSKKHNLNTFVNHAVFYEEKIITSALPS